MDDERIPLTGVFATRSPDRANPIGPHRVTVIDFTPPTSIRVDALEAIDGTPILDLKVAMTQAADAWKSRRLLLSRFCDTSHGHTHARCASRGL
jgi:tRNA (Thr-GGU) A37 N-methylase